jgi:hypothetical protein
MVDRQIGATAPKFLTKRRCLAKMRAPIGLSIKTGMQQIVAT